MDRLQCIENSALGPEIVLRMTRGAFDALRKHLQQDSAVEQFAYALAETVVFQWGTLLIVRELCFLGPDELSMQSAGGIAPTREAQGSVLRRAWVQKWSVIDFHTHAHRGPVCFSHIDHDVSHANGPAIARELPWPAAHAMVVFDNRVEYHDAVVYDLSLEGYRTLDRIEILGRGIELREAGGHDGGTDPDDSRYARQKLVPKWDQSAVARINLAVVGAGGTGAAFIETSAGIGVGSLGELTFVDPDFIEASNLPRLPYAVPGDVGRPKACMAGDYVRRRNVGSRVLALPCSVADPVVQARLAHSHVIAACVDNDGARKLLNELAVKYRIPYIDTGCEILMRDDGTAVAGQVRVVLPEDNACLVCCGGYDPSQAAIDLLDDDEVEQRAQHGYVRGGELGQHIATPSVACLNATIAQLAAHALLGLVHGEPFGTWDFAHFDMATMTCVSAKSTRLSDCPLCGVDGQANSDVPPVLGAVPPADLLPAQNTDGQAGQAGKQRGGCRITTGGWKWTS